MQKLSSKEFDEGIALANNYFDQGQYEKALEVYRSLQKSTLSHKQKAWIEYGIGQIFALYNKDQEAIASFNNSLLELSSDEDNAALKALNYYNLSLLYGEHDKAQDHAEEALKLFNLAIGEEGGDLSIREAYEYIAELHLRNSSFEQALSAYGKAMDSAASVEEKLPILNGIAVIQGKMKNYDKALKYFSDALEMARKMKEAPLSKIFFDMGLAAYENRHFSEAVDYLQEALRLKDAAGFLKINRAYEVHIRRYLADAARESGNDPLLIIQLFELEKNLNEDDIYYANVMLMLGHYYYKLRDDIRARDYYSRVLLLKSASDEEVVMAKDCLRRFSLN